MLKSNVSLQQLYFFNNSKKLQIMTKNYDLMISCKSNTISNYLILIKTCNENSLYLTIINTKSESIVRYAIKIENSPLTRACYDFLTLASKDDFDITNSDKDLLYQAYVELIAHLAIASTYKVTLAFDDIRLADLKVY